MATTNPKIIEFCRRWNARQPSLALINAIDDAFPHLGTCVPPIDPYPLAKIRGIQNVVEADIETAGILFAIGNDSYVVQLNKRHPEERKRFTLAHEIGHTFFLDLGFDSSDKEGSSKEECGSLGVDLEEERLCDSAAAQILMPQKQFGAMADRYGFGANGVLRLASQFRTSIRATAVRLVGFCSYRLLVCEWKRNYTTGAYETLWVERSSSIRPSWNAKFSVTVDQPGYRAFDGRQNFRGREWISLDGPVDHYYLDGARFGVNDDRIITSIILEGAAENLIRIGEVKCETQPNMQASLY